MIRSLCIFILASLFFFVNISVALAGYTKEQELGKLLYFDRFLSQEQNQSCASCHDPNSGFADPLNLRLPQMFPVSVGSDTTLVGTRNAPTAAYALFSPPFHYDENQQLYIGGQFWDGRAPTLKDQAMGPPRNPVEMGMKDKAAVLAALIDENNPNAARYEELFQKVYKINLSFLDLDDEKLVGETYALMAQAIGEYEKSKDFMAFTSKFDAVMAGAESFTKQEASGWKVFKGKGNCAACHPAPLFTDFTYDNLGIPKSDHPLMQDNLTDYGLGNNPVVQNDGKSESEQGKFKVSTLRNIQMTPPYGHNGFFVTLEEIISFYNERDVATSQWASFEPEVSENVNDEELGDLGLSEQEEKDLVAFLKTLTDRVGAKSYPPQDLTFLLP